MNTDIAGHIRYSGKYFKTLSPGTVLPLLLRSIFNTALFSFQPMYFQEYPAKDYKYNFYINIQEAVCKQIT